MFGGYVDLYAYGVDNSSRRSSIYEEKTSQAQSSETESNCCTSSVLGGFRSWPLDRNDFILIGECEEIQGPSTFLVIPESASKGVDTNGLILQLLSADYQGLGEGSVIPYEDTQSLLPDIQPNIHVLVNYFVLLDVQARGYVRPMCVAYVTADKFKLAKVFIQLRNALVQACIPIKSHNWQLFCEELNPMIENLKHTKQVRESFPTTESPSVVQKMQDENLDEALQDLESKLITMKELVEQERVSIEENSQELLKHIRLVSKSSCPSYMHLDALLRYFDQNKTVSSDQVQPQIMKVPLRQNFGTLLRPVMDLTQLGLVKTIYELYKALKYFERHYECIAVTATNSENMYGMCLHFGACVKNICLCGSIETRFDKSSSRKLSPETHVAQQEEYQHSPFIKENFLKLFHQITNRSETLFQNSQSAESIDGACPNLKISFEVLNKR